MQIGLVQQAVLQGGKTINVERALRTVEQAAELGAQLICFAELAFEEF